jgi:hypothetical protein
MKGKSSAITRSIDLAYPTNKAIVIISLFFFLGILFIQFISGKDLYSALYSGLRGGGSVFLAWALAREIDPDNELSAFVAAFLVFTGFLLFPSPLLLVLVLEILLLRIINRSTGMPSKILDSFAVLLLSGWISFQESWIFGLFAALAFFLDSFLPKPNQKNLFFGSAALIVSILTFADNAGKENVFLDANLGLFVLIVTLLFISNTLSSSKIKSTGDLTGKPLDPLRVQAAQLAALLNASLFAFLTGLAGIESLMPLWAAILGISFYRFYTAIKKFIKGFF